MIGNLAGKRVQRKRAKLKDSRQRFTMFDSVDLTQIPRAAVAVAGYVDGYWRTSALTRALWPHSWHLSITTDGLRDADCIDVEAGDATPEIVPSWIRRFHANREMKPCIYASLSTMPEVRRALSHAGILRGEVRLWVAHYTDVPHIEPGYDACQYTDHWDGRNLDASLCEPHFFA